MCNYRLQYFVLFNFQQLWGRTEGEAKLIKMMIHNGSSIEEVARITGLSITKINELLKV